MERDSMYSQYVYSHLHFPPPEVCKISEGNDDTLHTTIKMVTNQKAITFTPKRI